MKFILATKNAHKAREFSRILSPLGIRVLTQSEAGIEAQAPEDAGTFLGNALQKARAVFAASGGTPVLADDSGLEVEALGMRPGVYSARYGGPGLTDGERTAHLLEEMRDVPPDRRQARFVCCIVLVLGEGREYTFTGVCPGEIGYAPMGENGFGYDPVFMVGERSFSQLSPEEKDRISHRGRALSELYGALPGILGEEER